MKTEKDEEFMTNAFGSDWKEKDLKMFALLENVEIFRSGTWNGDTYTDEDLDAIVNNFNTLKGKKQSVPVKLGHSENQKLLQADGHAAAGWVYSLQRIGDKIVANVKDVPSRINDLIKSGAYKKISSEIYPRFKDGEGNVYNHVLRAISLLGVDVPAVSGLADVQAQYGSEQAFKSYSMNFCQRGNGMRFSVTDNLGKSLKKSGKYEIDTASYTPAKQRQYDDKLHAVMKEYSLTPVEAVVRLDLENNN